jgi:hypothetical protein
MPTPCDPDCGDILPVDCARAEQLRSKIMTQIERLVCAPDGPIEIDGVRYDSKGNAMKNLREMLDWTYSLCERASEAEEGPMVLWVGSKSCGYGDCCG